MGKIVQLLKNLKNERKSLISTVISQNCNGLNYSSSLVRLYLEYVFGSGAYSVRKT